MGKSHRVPTDARWASVVGYSRAVRAGDTIYVSGTVAVGSDGAIAPVGDAGGQTRRCLRIIVEAIEAAGGRAADVVRTRMYVTDIADWEAVGRAHGEVFGDVKPATSLVEVSGLVDPAALVEIEAVAVVGSGGQQAAGGPRPSASRTG